jgi:hypothetical protein
MTRTLAGTSMPSLTAPFDVQTTVTVCEINLRRLKKLWRPGLAGLKRLAIDEVYLGRPHKFITLVVDLDAEFSFEGEGRAPGLRSVRVTAGRDRSGFVVATSVQRSGAGPWNALSIIR